MTKGRHGPLLYKRGNQWYTRFHGDHHLNPHKQNYLNELNKGKARKKKSEATKYRDIFMAQLKQAGFESLFIPNENHPKELAFWPGRRYRFDFACEKWKIAIELQGGTWGNPVKCHRCHSTVMRSTKTGAVYMVREGGRHQNPKALESEYEKLNGAQKMGWRVFLFTPHMIKEGIGINLVKEIISSLG